MNLFVPILLQFVFVVVANNMLALAIVLVTRKLLLSLIGFRVPR